MSSTRKIEKALRRCPFCAHSELAVRDVESLDDTYQAALCLNCGARGPLSASTEGAWQRWNGRELRHVHQVDEEEGALCVCGDRLARRRQGTA